MMLTPLKDYKTYVHTYIKQPLFLMSFFCDFFNLSLFLNVINFKYSFQRTQRSQLTKPPLSACLLIFLVLHSFQCFSVRQHHSLDQPCHPLALLLRGETLTDFDTCPYSDSGSSANPQLDPDPGHSFLFSPDMSQLVKVR